MSVNVYLKNEVRNLDGFVLGSTDNMGRYTSRTKFKGVILSEEGDRLYLGIHSENQEVPECLADMVEEISVCDFFCPNRGTRETGIYRHNSAEAELEVGCDSRQLRFNIHIRSKKMSDVRELLRLIKIGAIRPNESYEGSQQGKSHRQLEDELASVRQFVNELVRGKIFFVRAAYIVRRLNQIFNSK